MDSIPPRNDRKKEEKSHFEPSTGSNVKRDGSLTLENWRTKTKTNPPTQSWRSNEKDYPNMTSQSQSRDRQVMKPANTWQIRKPNSNPVWRRQGEYADMVQNDPRKTINKNNRKQLSESNTISICADVKELDLSHLAKSNIVSILTTEKVDFINTIDSIDEPDKFVLTMKILAKVCTSQFEHESDLLLDVCKSGFLVKLLGYLMNLPFDDDFMKSVSLYWQDQTQFWENFVLLFETITHLSPSTSVLKCRALIDNCSKGCLDMLQHRHGFELPKILLQRLEELRGKLQPSKENKKSNERRKITYQSHYITAIDPPDDFRYLSIVPTSEDLKDPKPFVRPNIVEGSYQDVEHYLDVQFRLLREDCYGPLREGIDQYISNPNKKTYDNIRIYKNVRYVSSYSNGNKIGVVVQVDENTTKYFKTIRWDQSKRFIFGGLLLLTSDNCETFIAVTVIDQDKTLLRKGMIPVSVVDYMGDSDDDDLRPNIAYTMIESEIYYQPYLLALRALQDRSFPGHLAMSKYIVNIDREPKPPAYLSTNTKFEVKTLQSTAEMTVLDPSTWPTKEKLGLNESQYNAYQLALTNEFAVIQGPPGTGKTFLAVKVAETLLNNEQYPMLVICYTNHALDQFLKAILPITESIVRVGGQSRNEAMAKYNLIVERKNTHLDKRTKKMMWELGNDVRETITELQRVQEQIGRFTTEIWAYEYLKGYNFEIEFLGRFYRNHNIKASDPLEHWLFEGHRKYTDNITDEIERMMAEYHIETLDDEDFQDNVINDDDDVYLRTEPDLDDFGIGKIDELLRYLDKGWSNNNTSFSIDEANQQCALILKKCKTTLDSQTQYDTMKKFCELKSRIKLFEDMKAHWNEDYQLEVNRETNFAMIPTENRWMLYYRWVNQALDYKKMKIRVLQANVQRAVRRYEKARMRLDLEILETREVIGMTTSGAARLRELLINLSPKIVIVEEAAEVLEQHIITSLTKDCQHLILIGDHQQLRPSASNIKLARQFNLEVSLFERMIINGVRSRRLSVQHRMRPEIAALISPHIYEDLENHPSVENFPEVKGMIDNVFFMTHKYYEEELNDCSRCNYQEAELVLKLADYLMKQGYKSDEVTILTPYSGQLLYMKKERNNLAEYSSFLSKVKITTVDNYQGEESKIILLSLVRNNIQGKIGFLGIENRVCVALSRAREGFYIFGNMNILNKNSTLWRNIFTTLEANDSIASSLMLSCENHPETVTVIESAKDFSKVPEGGCELMCNYKMSCGHVCPKICHGYDNEHNTDDTRCEAKCERILCDLGHKCKHECWVMCGPCRRPMSKTLPKCGHTIKVPCHVAPDDPELQCTEVLIVASPICGHDVEKLCYQDLFEVQCKFSCKRLVPECGHECSLMCRHGFESTNAKNTAMFKRKQMKQIKCRCGKPCTKSKKDCSLTDDFTGDRSAHLCPNKCDEACAPCTVKILKKRSNCKHSAKVACNEDVDAKPCYNLCSKLIDCGHCCKNRCFQECGDCRQKVEKTIADCGHKVVLPCMDPATREKCKSQCERTLSCGHKCKESCAKICDDSKCTQPVTEKNKSSCGHHVNLPCNVYRRGNHAPEDLSKFCEEPCMKLLQCGHICTGSCGKCFQSRIHIACKRCD